MSANRAQKLRATEALRPDDHESWQLLCAFLAAGKTFEDVAESLDVSVGHLLEWANYTYKPRPPRKERHQPRTYPAFYDEPQARRILSARRASDGARKALEAFQ